MPRLYMWLAKLLLVVEIENPLEIDESIENVVKAYIGSKRIDKGTDLIFPRDVRDV